MGSIGRLLSQTKREKTGKKGRWLRSIVRSIASKKRKRGPRCGQLADCSPKQKGRRQERKAAINCQINHSQQKEKGTGRVAKMWSIG